MIKLNRHWALFFVYGAISILVITFLLLENIRLKASSKDPNERYRKSQDAIEAEIRKVRSGDGDAAINLSMYYEFVEGDFVSAYFWVVQARKLKHPDASQEVVDSLEDGVFSTISPNSEDESEILSELPDLE